MAPKNTQTETQNPGDLLHAAWREAVFAAKVGLARQTGQKARDLDDTLVKAEAEKIFIATSADMIASGMLGLTGDIPKTSIAVSSVQTPDVAKPQAPQAQEQDPGHAARIEKERANEQALNALKEKRATFQLLETSLEKLLNSLCKLTSTDKDNIQTYFSKCHPDHPNKSVQKAIGRKRLAEDDRFQLKAIIRQDLDAFESVLGSVTPPTVDR